jgi:uncharacterized membrane-anchored protein
MLKTVVMTFVLCVFYPCFFRERVSRRESRWERALTCRFGVKIWLFIVFTALLELYIGNLLLGSNFA